MFNNIPIKIPTEIFLKVKNNSKFFQAKLFFFKVKEHCIQKATKMM